MKTGPNRIAGTGHGWLPCRIRPPNCPLSQRSTQAEPPLGHPPTPTLSFYGVLPSQNSRCVTPQTNHGVAYLIEADELSKWLLPRIMNTDKKLDDGIAGTLPLSEALRLKTQPVLSYVMPRYATL